MQELLTLSDCVFLSWLTVDFTARYLQWLVVILETYTLTCYSDKLRKPASAHFQVKEAVCWLDVRFRNPLQGQQPCAASVTGVRLNHTK